MNISQNPATAFDRLELDNAQCDIETAQTFIEASDNFLDELCAWFAPDGCTPNPALLKTVHNAQVMLNATRDRLDAGSKSLDKLARHG